MAAIRRRQVCRMTGEERLRRSGVPVTGQGSRLLDFWSWASSDLVGNTLRGVLAEYLVALDLGVAGGVRAEWDRYDLRFDGIGIEVKSASYVQSWAQKGPSKIVFGIRPTVGWDADTGEYDQDRAPKRQADVYVFAVLGTKDSDSADPLDLDQWRFYVVATSTLNSKLPRQKTVSLGALKELGLQAMSFGDVRGEVRRILAVPAPAW